MDFHFWLHFGIGQQQIAAANFKKKNCTYQRGCRGNRASMWHTNAILNKQPRLYVTYQCSSLYNRAGMCNFCVIVQPSVPFFNAVSEESRWYVIVSIAVVQPRLYLQYFLSRLYNHACKPYTTVINCLFSTSGRKKWDWYFFNFLILVGNEWQWIIEL